MKLIRFIVVAALLISLSCIINADEIAPLALTNKTIGGGRLNAYTDGVYQGAGVNNIGLLIRTWGKVTYIDTTNKYFYINDGSNLADGTLGSDQSAVLGVRVSYDNLASGNSVTPPALDSYVMVTGISSTVIVNNNVRPNVRPRQDTDVRTVWP